VIQKGFRAFAARGHFHEERGAVLMLQSAARRKKAQQVRKYKATLVNWAAIVIQENWRRHKLREKAKLEQAKKGAEQTPKKGIGSRLVKSLSFSRRKKPPPKPILPDDLTADDLISARGKNPTPLVSSAEPSPGTPTAPEQIIQTKKRSLSFTRRKKAAEAAPAEGAKQTV
jgi:hypothetical protein